MRVVLYIAVSLDGFIADADGGVGWLKPFESVDYDYKSFYKTIGSVVMGRKTYEQALTFEEEPFKDVDCYVFSSRKLEANGNVKFVNSSVKDFVGSLKEKKNLWLVGGADLIQQFLEHDLI